MSENGSISIVGRNLSLEQSMFIGAVVVPAIMDALHEEGVVLKSFESSILRPKKLCCGKCEHCVFENVCTESEVNK